MGKASQNNLHLLSLLFEQESKHFKKILPARRFISFHEDYGIRYVYKNNPDPG